MNIKIPNYLRLFAKEHNNFYLHGNIDLKSLFRKSILKYNTSELSKLLNVSRRIIYYYKDGERNPSIKALLKIANTNEIDCLYRNFEKVYTWGHSGDSLPKLYSNELAYLTGLILGDGHISKRSEIVIWIDSKEFAKNISCFFLKLFAYKPIPVDFGTYLRLCINSKPIHFFFSRVIGLPVGKKKGRIFIPKFICLNKDYEINFLRGLFDSDGGITISKKGKCSILISSSTLPFLYEVKKLMENFDIFLGGPYTSGSRKGYEIRSFSSKNIIKFSKIIGTIHPKKSKRLNALVAQR